MAEGLPGPPEEGLAAELMPCVEGPGPPEEGLAAERMLGAEGPATPEVGFATGLPFLLGL